MVSLDGIPSFFCINCTALLGDSSKLAEGALDPIICAINKDVKEYQSQHSPLRDITGLHLDTVIDNNPLTVTIPTINYPPNYPPLKAISLQFSDKDVAKTMS